MDISLKFLGGAKTVTGSKYLLEADRKKVLIDCGLFQGKKEYRLRNWNQLPLDPSKIDCVVLTHAHLDHTGYLPRLVKDGFAGPIYCNEATRDIAKILLVDAGKLQEEEAQFAYKQGYSKHARPQPLFSVADAERVFAQFEVVKMQTRVPILDNISVTYRNAGHILGACFLEFEITGERQKKTIVFSGDLGREKDPVMFAPQTCDHADVVVVESTYGDRNNPIENVEQDIIDVVHEAQNMGGLLLIPAFALGRTQNLIFYLLQLVKAGKIPSLPIYIDSPMAISVSELYEKHGALNKIEVSRKGNQCVSMFDDPLIHFCNTPESSKALNDLKKTAIVISASGMCTGGRILHHLYHRLGNPSDILLFVGYQGEGTRGRDILEGKKSIRIFGQQVDVKCQVRVINGLSAHADQGELIGWLRHFRESPKFTFITHGEGTASASLKGLIEGELNWNVFIPEYLESFELFNGI